MRHASVVVRASVAVVVAISVGACAATPASPSPGQTAPAASASVSAHELDRRRRVAIGIDGCGSVAVSRRSRPGRRSTAGSRSANRSPRAGSPPTAQSLWVHEPTSLVRVDLATSAITGQVPMDWMEYGYATTGAGAVWQTDYEHDVLLRIDPVTGKVVASIPVGSATGRRRRDSGRRCGWPTSTVRRSRASIPRPTASSRRSRSVRPGPAGPQIMTAGPDGVWVDVPNMG